MGKVESSSRFKNCCMFQRRDIFQDLFFLWIRGLFLVISHSFQMEIHNSYVAVSCWLSSNFPSKIKMSNTSLLESICSCHLFTAQSSDCIPATSRAVSAGANAKATQAGKWWSSLRVITWSSPGCCLC